MPPPKSRPSPVVFGMIESCAKRPTQIVPKTPQTRCTESAPTGSSSFTLSKKSTAKTTSTPAIETDDHRAADAHEGARRGDRDQAGETAVQDHAEVGLAEQEPRGEGRAHGRGGRGRVGGDRDAGDVAGRGGHGAARD